MALDIADDCAYCIDGNMPAGTHDILGLAPMLCRYCLGVVDLIPLHQIPTDLRPEVTDHDHH